MEGKCQGRMDTNTGKQRWPKARMPPPLPPNPQTNETKDNAGMPRDKWGEPKGDERRRPTEANTAMVGRQMKGDKGRHRPSRTDTPFSSNDSNHRSPGGFKGMGSALHQHHQLPRRTGAPAPGSAPFGRSCHVFGGYSWNCIVIPEAQQT